MMENTITISQERYDELIKSEARMQFLLAYVSREIAYTNADILYYLGVSEKEEDHEESV